MTLRTFTSNPNLSRTFDGLRGDQVCAGELSVEVHPSQPVVLIQIHGTAIMVGLDGEAVRVLIDLLIRSHDHLLERAAGNGNSRP